MARAWRVWLRRRGVLVALAAVVTLVAAAGLAYATIPDNGKVFTACMLKGVGTVRLIDPTLAASNLMSHCTSLEAQVSWNQQGQAGAAGTAGPTGPAGLAGRDGSNGTNGTDGKDGNDGKDGVSVTESPAGTSCANGGVALTAADGTGYVCNGADGASASSPAYSTGLQVAITGNAGFPVVASLQLDPGSYVLEAALSLSNASPFESRFSCMLSGQQVPETVDVDPEGHGSMSLVDTTTLTQQQAVSIQCGSGQGGGVSTTLVAIRVGSIN